MKQFKIFTATALVFTLLMSCNNSDNKTATTDSTKTTDSTVATAPATPTVQTSDIVVIKHKVQNFTKWKAAYDSHDSANLAAGLHNFVIGRGVEDSNMVLVALRADDTTKAKQFLADKALKAAMQKAGVVSAPSMMIVHMERFLNDTVSNRVIVSHKVKDFTAWKKVFDSHKDTRVNAGLADRSIGRSINDSNMVTLVFNILDMNKAKAFMSSKDLKDRMAESGVISKPEVLVYHVVNQY